MFSFLLLLLLILLITILYTGLFFSFILDATSFRMLLFNPLLDVIAQLVGVNNRTILYTIAGTSVVTAFVIIVLFSFRSPKTQMLWDDGDQMLRGRFGQEARRVFAV